MSLFVVDERFDPPIDAEKLNPYSDALSPCLKTYDVRWVSSYVARDGSQCVCIYEAPDAESVRRAYRAAAVPFKHMVWAATRYTHE
ncbi:MAG TPA: nickel-binding protein [Polyangia bacterium]|nr:nickel-binding protein [Polyangia bacterium]